MLRIFIATALIATFGVSGAYAGGRSKDDRAAFWQTLHQSKQPWPYLFKTAPDSSAAKKPDVVKPNATKPAQ